MTTRIFLAFLALAVAFQFFIFLRLDFKSRESAVEIIAKRSTIIISGAPAALKSAPLPGGLVLDIQQKRATHNRRAPR
jgi:hypothetical protein